MTSARQTSYWALTCWCERILSIDSQRLPALRFTLGPSSRNALPTMYVCMFVRN